MRRDDHAAMIRNPVIMRLVAAGRPGVPVGQAAAALADYYVTERGHLTDQTDRRPWSP